MSSEHPADPHLLTWTEAGACRPARQQWGDERGVEATRPGNHEALC